jgi:hypothetical protein
MALNNYLNRIERIDALIRQKRTGTPKELAEKLNISERWLYHFLEELKSELNCPIKYDRMRRSYIYEKRGRIIVGFENITLEEKSRVNGGFVKKKTNCIYLFSDQYLISTEKLLINFSLKK